MPEFGRLIIILGIVLILLGLGMSFFGKIPFVGKLPGDIFIKRENFSFYFPIATSIILSIILTLILNFISRK
jgi:Zn-dependent protease with chaperone function